MTTAHHSSQKIPPSPATPSSSAGQERVAPVKRRLDASLARAATPPLTTGPPSGRGARSPLSNGRRPLAAGGRKSTASRFSLSCADDNKENSPALGQKIVSPSLGHAHSLSTQRACTPSMHKAATLTSSRVSSQQALDSRPQKPAQLTVYSKAPHRSPLAPMTRGVDPTPRMTPHALQFHVVAVPFWGLQAGVPDVAATEGVPRAAAPTAAAPATAAPTPAARTSAGPRTPAAPFSPTAAGHLTAAAGLTSAVLATASQHGATSMTLLTDAEQAGVASVQIVPHQTPLPAASSAERAVQARPSATVLTAAVAASRLSPPLASSSVTGGQQITTGRQSTDSLAASITAGAAKQTQPRGSKRRTASAAPAASQMVTRSQAAAQKHVERMQTRSRQSKRFS